MRKAIRSLCVVLTVLCGLLLTLIGYFDFTLPDNYKVTQGRPLWLTDTLQAQKIDGDGAKQVQLVNEKSYNSVIKWLGIIPVKTVSVEVVESKVVTIGGMPFGIKLYADGVMVVSYSQVDTSSGKTCPAKNCGIQIGDLIVSVNGIQIYTNDELATMVEKCAGKPLKVKIRRNNVLSTVTLKPERSVSENKYKVGMWVRDSSAGIGTVTFYDPETRILAGLGHPICDVDTGEIIPISSGEIVPARIFGVTKSKSGTPGELRGGFEMGSFGPLLSNDSTGIYASVPNGMVGQGYEVALKQEITEGEAQILTTVDGKQPQWYTAKIKKINHRDPTITRNMVIEITDPALLEKTGGIVQGMSGSPIIQNGKLIGAVTHVLVNDPTKGYAIFVENMLETAQNVSNKQLKDVA